MVIYFMINQTIKACQKIETFQKNAAQIITNAIRCTSQIKLYNELGLESLELRR